MTALTLSALRQQYLSGSLTPREFFQSLQQRFEALADDAIFIHWLTSAELEPYLVNLESASPDALPLYGIPFAIKDNIDLAGVPTTAGCPDYRYTPTAHAFVVQQLIDAGAIPIGKTNLDQFATGLVGVRSPYGVPKNPLAPEHIPGGSSSGSAVAVAQSLAVFSLGTDTAGSGRVPAAFNELVGIKPTRGRLSTSGVVPACRSLDCVSIFANNLEDANQVLQIATAYDPNDPYSRKKALPVPVPKTAVRIGVPSKTSLRFFEDKTYETSFETYLNKIGKIEGVELVEIDFEPFLEAAKLLYHGPWIAERYAAVGEFLEKNPESLVPVTHKIISGGAEPTAVQAFQAFYKLQEFKKLADVELAKVDAIITPTAGRFYRVDEVMEDPIATNTNLGYYTNFMNLLDYAALAIPADRTSSGLPFGITLFSESFEDEKLLTIAAKLNGETFPVQLQDTSEYLDLVVCGAHMRGLPLNHQLLDLGATYLGEVRSAPAYKFLCLHKKQPIRPGMVRIGSGDGASILMEQWRLPITAVGSFFHKIASPLGLGSVELEDGTWTQGFICEAAAEVESIDISSFGSWKAYLDSIEPTLT